MPKHTPTTAEPPVSSEDLIAAIGRKAATLRQRDGELLGRQLDLEGKLVRATPPNPVRDPQQVARELLNGFASSALPQAHGEALHAIIVERQAIVLALETLEKTESRERLIVLAQVIQETGADWRKIVHRRALAILELRKANAEAARFRQQIMKRAKGMPTLSCDFTAGIFAHPPVVSDRCGTYDFLSACVSAGIITQKEIDDAS